MDFLLKTQGKKGIYTHKSHEQDTAGKGKQTPIGSRVIRHWLGKESQKAFSIIYLDFCNFFQTPHFENLPHPLSLLRVQRRLPEISPVVKDISEL